jgi:RNA polymerase sigma-70 factor (ECF subfamily)
MPGPTAQPDPDADVLASIRAGDSRAWHTLFTRHQDRLFAICYRMTGDRDKASDLTQDAMVKVIQGLASFDGSSLLTTWMTRVTMNVCLTYLRSAKLRKHASLDAPTPGTDPDRALSGADRLASREQTPGSRVESDDARRLVALGLSRLEPDQRAILVLRDVRGLDYDQIATVLSITVGTVKSRLFRARLALRQEIEKHTKP